MYWDVKNWKFSEFKANFKTYFKPVSLNMIFWSDYQITKSTFYYKILNLKQSIILQSLKRFPIFNSSLSSCVASIQKIHRWSIKIQKSIEICLPHHRFLQPSSYYCRYTYIWKSFIFVCNIKLKYRTHAMKGRSWLVATPCHFKKSSLHLSFKN